MTRGRNGLGQASGPEWSAPEPFDALPYAHWWFDKDKYDRGGPAGDGPEDFVDVSLPLLFLRSSAPLGTEGAGKNARTVSLLNKVGDEVGKQYGATNVPLPRACRRPDDITPPPPDDWTDNSEFTGNLPEVPENTVLVGIIDTGIALGHRRFRLPGGETRVIASWQQGAVHRDSTVYQKDSAVPFVQNYLPFGEELLSTQIEDLIRKHSGGTLTGPLDEEAFNRAAKLVEPERTGGHRDLDHPGAHGTHVADLAAGYPPGSLDEDTLKRMRILAVNLPPQFMHGTAGNFLAYFAVYGLERIADLAKALWRKNHPCGAQGAYPLVVNFSYGMMAGPKDGSHILERAIEEIVSAYPDGKMQVLMPVGNENLDRGASGARLGHGGESEFTIPWRIQPSDQTSNFVEIWAEVAGKDSGYPDPSTFTLEVTPPGMPPLKVPNLSPDTFADLGNYARVYRPELFPKGTVGDPPETEVAQEVGPDTRDYGDRDKRWLHYVICVAPTLVHRAGAAQAPAGVWTITCRHAGPALDLRMFVQSDQPFVRYSRSGLKSYFDHPAYRVHGARGTPKDSFDYETGVDLEPYADEGPVQRKGTNSAIATGRDTVLIAGYRVSDGKPAPYSATTAALCPDGGRNQPTVSFPSDDGPAHFGLLGAGARDGSAQAFRGTSMSCALATRMLAEDIASTGPVQPGETFFRQAAGEYSTAGRPGHYHDLASTKGGAGHLPVPRCLSGVRPARRSGP